MPPSPVPGSAQAAPPAASAAAGTVARGQGAPQGATVYLADGGSVEGKALHAPSCKTPCVLSGDSTAALLNMTWRTWNGAEATGTGTEQLEDCVPDCAGGKLHAVPVTVALSRPVMVCLGGKAAWYWTRASFTWPAGLPRELAGGNAPVNPWDFGGIADRAAKSC